MDRSLDPTKPDRLSLTVDVATAYVSRNSLRAADLPALLTGIYAKFSDLDAPSARSDAVDRRATPGQIRKSITPDALISFLDGRPYKTLKRHLTANGLDADGYRARFGLPPNYPLVAPNYATQRSMLARDVGFGMWRRRNSAAGTGRSAG